MTKTNFKKVIETNCEGLKIFKVDLKEFIDKETKKPGKYKSIKFTYEHPQDNGNVVRGAPVFSTPGLTFPRGISMNDRRRLSAMAVFDTEDEDNNLFISSKSKTQIKGWVPSENIKITMKDGKSFAKAKRDGEIYSEPAPDSKEIIGEFVKEDVMTIVDQKELNDESSWHLVAHGGQDGFFSTFANKLAEIIQGDKRCGLTDKSVDVIRAMIYKGADGVYWPVDKETGEAIEGKKPSMYFTCSYFPPKEGKKENYVKFLVPGQKEPLNLEVMEKCSIKVKTAVLKLIDVYVSGDKIVPHLYLTEATVIDLDEIKYHDQLEDENDELAQDEGLVSKLAKQIKASKKFEIKEKVNTAVEADGEDIEGTDFNALIKNQPVKSKGDDLSDPTMEDDVQIPGLPDDE